MRKLSAILCLCFILSACDSTEVTGVTETSSPEVGQVAAKTGNFQAGWGQATAVFAEMGEMGEHASNQPNPRVGLRNLARALAAAGLIPDDSMHALGAFVAADLGLSIDACSP